MAAPWGRRRSVVSLPLIGGAMKGMNLSGKPGMVQPMQMPPTLGHPPMPAIQPRFGTLQFTTGPQQPSLTMHFGELALLVVAGAIATLMHGFAEQPGGPKLVVQRDHRGQSGHLIQQIEQGL